MAKRKADSDDPVQVRIQLPLPPDIAQTLIKIIGKTYPNTMIGSNDRDDLREKHFLTLLIDQQDRHKSAKARKKYLEIKEFADGWIGDLSELDPNGVSLSPHQTLIALWTRLARDSFNLFEDETNYLETRVYDKEVRREYIFTLSKGRNRTPHELRMAAESRADALENELAELKEQLRQCREGSSE